MTRVIEMRIEFDVSPERVWRALTLPEEIASWFGDTAELDLRPGGSGSFGWEDHGTCSVRVEVVEPPTRLVWRWAKDPDVDVDEGVSTSVEWVLKERADGGTLLELTESGFETDDHLEENTGGWKAELAELVAFVS
jgi:uncharacterized protein YndB with AHSA1/START domain